MICCQDHVEATKLVQTSNPAFAMVSTVWHCPNGGVSVIISIHHPRIRMAHYSVHFMFPCALSALGLSFGAIPSYRVEVS